MKRLWDVEQEKHSATLRLETLEELGGAQRIVRTHVDRTLGDLPDEERSAAVAPPSSRHTVQDQDRP